MSVTMTSVKGPLSDEQLDQFHEDGYLVVPKALLDENGSFRDFVQNVVEPSLAQYGDLSKLTKFATGEVLVAGRDKLAGIMIRNDDGSGPLPNANGEQDCILKNLKLLAILDQLHGGRRWEWLHPENVGWIHVRLPMSSGAHFPRPQHRWHVDGGHFTPHFLSSPEQSVVVLPMVRDVQVGGGNTVVLPQSHHYMAQLLHRKNGLGRKLTQNLSPLANKWPTRREIAPCQAGDVLIMHPFLVHAAGFRCTRSGFLSTWVLSGPFHQM